MKRRIRALLELAALVGAALLLLLPGLGTAEKAVPQGSGQRPEAGAAGGAPQAVASSVQPLTDASLVAALFQPAPRASGSAAAPAPMQPEEQPSSPPRVEWLRFVGSATESGRHVYFLKDTRTGRLIRASPSAAGSEWEVVAQDERFIDVRNGEEVYRVPLR